MSDERDDPGPMPEESPRPARWREFTIRLPHDFAAILERARSEQQQMEDREVEMSELVYWLLTMGMQGRETLLAQQKQAEQRVVTPGDLGLRMPSEIGVTCGCGKLPIHSTQDPRFHTPWPHFGGGR